MMRSARILTGILTACLPASVLIAAEFRPAAHEVWAGTYRCEAMDRDPNQWPAYSSRVRLTLEEGAAHVTRESSRIRESLRGQVAADGTVKLEGSGDSKEGGGTRWRYRFDGKFEGDRFAAKGAMLSASLATKLRDCSMELTRVQASGGPASTHAAAPAQAPVTPPPQPAAKMEEALSTSASVPATAVRVMEGRELNFTKGNDSAVIQGSVLRNVPHRYPIAGKKGQTLSVTLEAEGGARLDVYEPGASLEMQTNGFVVQGARMKGTPDGSHVSAELPGDGKYLLFVRALRDEAPYTLEVTMTAGAAGAGSAEFWSNEKLIWTAALLGLAALGVGILIYSKRDRRLFRSR